MLECVFALRDKKAGYFLQPLHSRKGAQDFIDEVNVLTEEQFKEAFLGTPIAESPEGFSVYDLGTFDNCTGKYDLHDSPQHLVDLVHLDVFLKRSSEFETPDVDDVIAEIVLREEDSLC